MLSVADCTPLAQRVEMQGFPGSTFDITLLFSYLILRAAITYARSLPVSWGKIVNVESPLWGMHNLRLGLNSLA